MQQAAERIDEVSQNILSATEGIATPETAVRETLGSVTKPASQSKTLHDAVDRSLASIPAA